jgi:aryl-alcohol dehydrogenase-like predicted oxidoreductase
VGISNVGVAQLDQARKIVQVVSVQNRYSMSARDSEDVLEACERDGLGFIPWFPLNAGSVEGGPIEEVARAHRATPMQVALAWLLRRSPVMFPIPGTSSVAHLEENVAAAALGLEDGEFERLAA